MSKLASLAHASRSASRSPRTSAASTRSPSPASPHTPLSPRPDSPASSDDSQGSAPSTTTTTTNSPQHRSDSAAASATTGFAPTTTTTTTSPHRSDSAATTTTTTTTNTNTNTNPQHRSDSAVTPLPPLELHGARSQPARLFKVRTFFGRHQATALIDSGASTDFIDPAFARRCELTLTSSSRSVKLADGSIVDAQGQVHLTCQVDRQKGWTRRPRWSGHDRSRSSCAAARFGCATNNIGPCCHELHRVLLAGGIS